jgi:hypothetical protein
MELIKKIKRIFAPISSEPNINNIQNKYISFEDTVATLQHYPKHTLAIALLEAIKLNEMIDPKSKFVVTEKALVEVCDVEVFKTAESLIEMVHDGINNEMLDEIKNIEGVVH